MTSQTLAELPGLHHVTAITGDVKRNVAFYTGPLGLRLVKVTVNYDDPTSYHLYYGDRFGTPGTLMTFFGWPGAYGQRAGAGRTSASAYGVDPASLLYWRDRLTSHGVAFQSLQRFGQGVLSFADPDGMALEIIGSRETDPTRTWDAGGVGAEHALRGFHSVTLAEMSLQPTQALLTEQLGFERVGEEGDRTRFRAGGTGSGGLLDIVTLPAGSVRGRDGVGGVHHVAFRTPDEQAQRQWQKKISDLRLGVSPVMDRDYFHSIYFREPGGVLFEIATDGPGMTVNEPEATLGTKLMLPRAVEQHRAELERVLPPLR